MSRGEGFFIILIWWCSNILFFLRLLFSILTWPLEQIFRIFLKLFCCGCNKFVLSKAYSCLTSPLRCCTLFLFLLSSCPPQLLQIHHLNYRRVHYIHQCSGHFNNILLFIIHLLIIVTNPLHLVIFNDLMKVPLRFGVALNNLINKQLLLVVELCHSLGLMSL